MISNEEAAVRVGCSWYRAGRSLWSRRDPHVQPNSHGAQRRHATAGGSHIRARCHSYPDAGTCRHHQPKAHGHFHTGSNGHDGSRACPNGGARCRGARYHGAGADPDIGTYSYQRSSANTNSPTNLDSCTHRHSRSQSNPLSDGHTARACPRYQSGGHNGQFGFSPANITVEAGDTVNWTVTGIGHTTTSGVLGAETGIWASGFKRVGESFAFTFEEEGEFPYFCRIHPTMRGRVTVVGSGQVSTSEEEPAPTEPLSPAGYGGLDY